MIDVELGRCR